MRLILALFYLSISLCLSACSVIAKDNAEIEKIAEDVIEEIAEDLE